VIVGVTISVGVIVGVGGELVDLEATIGLGERLDLCEVGTDGADVSGVIGRWGGDLVGGDAEYGLTRFVIGITVVSIISLPSSCFFILLLGLGDGWCCRCCDE